MYNCASIIFPFTLDSWLMVNNIITQKLIYSSYIVLLRLYQYISTKNTIKFLNVLMVNTHISILIHMVNIFKTNYMSAGETLR